ncbi:MAG: hypothetical protein ACI9AD_000336 [Nitriliruptoraceae bacterium]|jgi:hypothetical protein
MSHDSQGLSVPGRATPRAPSNADYDALFQLTATPTLEVNLEGTLLRANAAAARMLHTSLEGESKRTLGDLLGEKAMAVLTMPGPLDVEAELHGDSGGAVALRLWSVARQLPGAKGKRFTVQIVRREGREAVDLDRRAEASRLSLLDDVSHNLGTPLSIVAGYAETLAERWDDLDHEDIATATAAINRHARRAVNELRALQARVRVHSNGIGTLPSSVLVAWLRRMLSGPLAANGTVLLDDLRKAHVTVDVGVARQALLNICQMAMGCSQPPVSVSIQVTAQARGTEFRITSTPPVLPAATVDHYARATNALARSANGHFTPASVDMPAHLLWLPDAAGSDRQPPRRIPVAVIEDDPDTAALIRASLHSSSAVFDLVADERTLHAGLTAVSTTRPRILLLDQNLIDQLATDELSELHAAAPGMTIVILCSQDQPGWVSAASAAHWLEKPRVLADLGPELIAVLASPI